MAGTAIFDLDRTLTRQPTWLRFVWRFNRRRPLFWFQIPWLAGCAIAHKAGLIDRTAIKNHFLATLGWASREQVERAGRDFAVREIETGLRPGARDLIVRHRGVGDRIYLATAASDFIADPIADLLGVDGVFCTQTVWKTSAATNHMIDGRNCYGAEKLRCIQAALARGDVKRPLTIYSDHVSDLQLLILANQGVAANPSKALRDLARQNGLSITDLDLIQANLPGAQATILEDNT
ncbi:HAD family hydrolase [Henriciella marina]|uniref:HAD family hydrolase n=1 Tax=Henriciella marina TaxID=453851 RepID=UPI000375A4F0|nr:HAD-IB family phosphatase [Henriciella marina]